MSYAMFIATEMFGFVILYLTHKGIFSLLVAFLVTLLMLALSFHVMVRKPDATGIRMACFSWALWVASILSAKLALEFRSILITGAAAIVCLITAAVAAMSSYSLWNRPTQLDVED